MRRSAFLVVLTSSFAFAQPDGTSGVRDRVAELKERVRLSQEHLRSLELEALNGELGASRYAINHRNELGAGFELESFAYALDGATLKTRYDATSALDRDSPIALFEGRLPRGHHLLTGRLVYRGTGFHVFKYAEGYRFTVEASCVFDVEPGKARTIDLIGYDRGGTDFTQRPGLKCDVR
jgi:hypothetical protein